MDGLSAHRLRARREHGLEILLSLAPALFPISGLVSGNEFCRTLPRHGYRFFNRHSKRQSRSSTIRAWRAFQCRAQFRWARGTTGRTSYGVHSWSPRRFDAQRRSSGARAALRRSVPLERGVSDHRRKLSRKLSRAMNLLAASFNSCAAWFQNTTSTLYPSARSSLIVGT